MRSIRIDDALFERAEKLASERGVSVEDVVRDLIARETGMVVPRQARGESPKAYRARMEMVEMARNSRHGMIGEWSREEAYAERLSRYERLDLRGDRTGDSSGKVANGDANHDGK